jgi:FMN phosphatase YigB (HAD superfamily)/nicotinamide mononucleotide adenylyltransferase
MRLSTFDQFVTLLRSRDTRAVALDIRGTLLRAPRGGHLTRAFRGAQLSDDLLKAVDAEVPRLVLERYPHTTSVMDWTLVTVLEAGRYAAEHGEQLDSTDLEQAFQRLNVEYRTRSQPLVTDEALLETASALTRMGIRVVFAADGPSQRERDALRAVFPRTAQAYLDLFSSEAAGTNKLGSAYFVRLVEYCAVPASRVLVIGDRMDKDVRPALDVGCEAILIGPETPGVNGTDRFRDITAPVPERIDVGLVLGRFQPLHLEHVRYLEAALDHARHVCVGITHPFNLLEAGGQTRNDARANPLPYWLRRQSVMDWAERSRVGSRISVIPVPLSDMGLRSVLDPESTVLLTDVEPWSQEKRALVEGVGHRVIVLPVGSKRISGTHVRELIRSGDDGWLRLVPELDVDLLRDIRRYVCDGDPGPT